MFNTIGKAAAVGRLADFAEALGEMVAPVEDEEDEYAAGPQDSFRPLSLPPPPLSGDPGGDPGGGEAALRSEIRELEDQLLHASTENNELLARFAQENADLKSRLAEADPDKASSLEEQVKALKSLLNETPKTAPKTAPATTPATDERVAELEAELERAREECGRLERVIVPGDASTPAKGGGGEDVLADLLRKENEELAGRLEELEKRAGAERAGAERAGAERAGGEGDVERCVERSFLPSEGLRRERVAAAWSFARAQTFARAC
jgi:hypothetical protein